MKYQRLFAASVAMLFCGAFLLNHQQQELPLTGELMAESTVQFLSTLSADEKAQTSFDYDSEERLDWHFIPRERNGLPLKSLQGKSLKAAQKLIASGLSEIGYTQALNVMSLEEVLYLLEEGDREYRRERRDPQKYYLSIFGTPGKNGLWGWRLEGHHLSLNYSIKDGQIVSSTPEFFGANPGTIDSGVGRQLRVLGAEEDLARQILSLCDAAQMKQALIDKKAPKEIRDAGVAQPTTDAALGLKAADMSGDQRKILAKLLTEYLQNMPADVESSRRAQINGAGIDSIHFAWWGDAEIAQPHYYRIQGPTFLIEYNNVQNNANHVHSIWRDIQGDFNESL